MRAEVVILGGGMTGVAAGWASGLAVYEAEETPGGICSSYYLRPGTGARLPSAPEDGEAYRFEIGGGHWIFGGDPAVLGFIRSLAPVKQYRRHSGVFFADDRRYVPYPLQNHLRYLDREVGLKALTEILTSPRGHPRTMADWLEQSFGPTATELFFGPFHELYTAGLWTRIAPQDGYKSPVDPRLVLKGAVSEAPPVGYNVTFVYPIDGLDALASRMAERCRITYGSRVVAVDTAAKELSFEDGSGLRYETLISTLPLNRMLQITGLAVDEEPDPYTSVLVLNVGAVKGPECPADHWLYIPRSEAGFHRVGFYSNVDSSFLPASARGARDRVSIYVERAFPGGERPTDAVSADYARHVVRELQHWGFIKEAEAVDPTWIDVAYTWTVPGSTWRGKAMKKLEENDVVMVGRYGRWVFQGIADSIRDGFIVGAAATVNVQRTDGRRTGSRSRSLGAPGPARARTPVGVTG